MTEIERIIEGQKALNNEITARAIELGFENKPIFDGVCDPQKYLSSEINVMWVLKEAYDDFDANDQPIGGGWEIFKSWISGDSKVTKSMTWQPIMYVLRALDEKNNWDDIPWVWQEKEKYLEYMKSCAYINVNKMPGGISSGDLSYEFSIWKDILKKQMILYNPHVVIFGNTFSYFESEDYIHNAKPVDGVMGATGVYVTELNNSRMLLIDAYHPNQRKLKRQEYVDSILLSIRDNLDKIIE